MSVTRWREPATGSWSCSRCGDVFGSDGSWRLDYSHDDGSHFAFVVCGACADALRPVRLTVDLTALAARDGADDLCAVASLVANVLQHRGEPSATVLALRWSDVHVLAETYDESPKRFAARLNGAGVLANQPDGSVVGGGLDP